MASIERHSTIRMFLFTNPIVKMAVLFDSPSNSCVEVGVSAFFPYGKHHVCRHQMSDRVKFIRAPQLDRLN